MITQTRRREFLKAAGALAVSPAFGSSPGRAKASDDRTLNILAWEGGFNSDDVLDPFRKEFAATVRAEGLTSDPAAVDRLRKGETGHFDIVNVNNPFARKQLWPEGLIQALPRERFEPFFDTMLPAFHMPYKWSLDETGEHLLALPGRLGPFNFVVNANKISRRTAENEGFRIFLDPALKGRYGIVAYDAWNVIQSCIIADVDPFRTHTEQEINAVGEAAKQVFAGARTVGYDLTQMNRALVDGDIDAYLSGGTFTASAARYAGRSEVRGITPDAGPMAGKGGVVWAALISVVNKPGVSPLAEEFIAYTQRPDASKTLALADGTFNPVAQMGSSEVFRKFGAKELDAMQWDSFEEDLSRSADYDIVPDYGRLHAMVADARSQTL